ncbi:MAG TPA: hypothetical protein VGV90_11285 [Solirubrobacteraceae bacterium]|nr:hypothetical protein [Solirubrobacteraceae bacterium]
MLLLDLIAADDAAARGIWTDTVGLLFTYAILIPALVTGLIVVAIVSGRGEKQEDDEIRDRWARKRPPGGS